MESAIAHSPAKVAPASLPSAVIEGRHVVSTGKWLKIARIHDEVWLPDSPPTDPARFVAALRTADISADLFTFAQHLDDATPRFGPPQEWDNVAIAPAHDFKAWWEGLPQESRKNARKAEKRGIVFRLARLDDDLVRGIKALYDETPIRQGRRFWHYGKDLERVRLENSSYLDRCDFVAGYIGDELVGFIKIVYIGQVARIMQILACTRHFDKHPMNALIAKAMETCAQKGMTHLIYGQYVYGQKANSSITEFKRRNGFKQQLLPRYWMPLTLKGRLALRTKLQHGIVPLLPEPWVTFLLDARARVYQNAIRKPL